MYGMPSEMAPTGFDTSMLLTVGLPARRAGGADPRRDDARHPHAAGVLPHPVRSPTASSASSRHATGWFPAKLVLIMFRGLRRTPLRTSLTYLALFVLTLVLVPHLRGPAHDRERDREKEANFKAIVTHKTMIPSQMPPGYYDRVQAARASREAAARALQPVNGDKDIMSWSFVIGTTDKMNPRKDTMVFLLRARAGQGADHDGRPRRPDRRGEGTARAGHGRDDEEPAGHRHEQEPAEDAERPGRSDGSSCTA